MKTFLLVLLFAFSVYACSEDPEMTTEDTDPDALLLDVESRTTTFTWFKNSPGLLESSQISGHSESQLRTRYNPTAAALLTSEGVVQAGITFPEGSLIVKELYEGGNYATKAMMYKDPTNTYADANGWVWGYFNSENGIRASAMLKGAGCVGCHSQTGHIDQTLMNAAFE